MTRVYKLRCDACGGEDEIAKAGHWYEVERYNTRNFAEAGDSDVFHFCSAPCIASWANRREIVRNAS